MTVSIGIECASKEFFFVISKGTQIAAVLLDSGKKTAPTTLERPQVLRWVRLEIEALLNTYRPNIVILKGVSSGKRFAVGQERAQFEGVAMETVASNSFDVSIERIETNGLKARLGISKSEKVAFPLMLRETFPDLQKYLCESALASLCGLPKE